MADQIQNSINTAIDTIIKNRINALTLDKTVIAVIDSLVDIPQNIYRVKYDGGYFNAISQTSTPYKRGMSVYVQIPQNNMSKEKLIIGRAYSTREEKLTDSVISAINSYSIMGGNLLLGTQNTLPDSFGVRSYHNKNLENGNETHPVSHRAQYLLTSDTTQSDYYDLDTGSLDIYRDSATGLMVEADFRTALTTEQKTQAAGLYGIILNLVFENSAYAYGETNGEIFEYFAEDITTTATILNPAYQINQNKYQEEYVPARQQLADLYPDDEQGYAAALEELNQEYAYLFDIDLPENQQYIETIKTVKDYADELYGKISQEDLSEDERIAQVEALLKTDGWIDMYMSYIQAITDAYATDYPQLFSVDASNIINSYIQLLKDIKAIYSTTKYSTEGLLSSIKKEYDAWLAEAVAPPAEKIVSYSLTSNRMTGVPFYFSSWSTQYEIFDIDFTTFKRIDSILFFKDGFVQDNNKCTKDDIFMKNLRIYALQPISAVNGDYSLKINAPEGYIFSESTALTDSLNFKAQVFKQYTVDLSDSAVFQWFKSSPGITSAGYADYRPYGGLGWKYLERKGNRYAFEVTKNENPAYTNKYKCVAILDSSIILSQEFIVYNETVSDNVVIDSDLGNLFTFDNGAPTLTASFYDIKTFAEKKEKILEERVPAEDNYKGYSYSWAILINGQRTFLNTLEKDITVSTSLDDNMNAQNLRTLLRGVTFYAGEELIEDSANLFRATRIKYPVRNIAFESMATFECYVQEDGQEKGSASITLQNQTQGAAVDYNISIENGEQIFQYDEYGVAPNDEKLKNPLEIKPLICHLFNPTGLEVSSGNYKVEWIIPVEDSLIISNNATLSLDPTMDDDIPRIDNNSQCSFKIAGLYDESCQNNQIICRVTYNGQTFKQSTNFFFGKVGSNGTNGTDMVLKIEPVSSSIPENQPLTVYRANWVENYNGYTGYTVLALNDGATLRYNSTISDLDLSLSATNDSTNHLRARLFQKGDEISIDSGTVRWNVAGSTKTLTNNVGKYLSIESGRLTWKEDFQTTKQDNFIIRAWINYLEKDYYAFYTLPVIEYEGALPGVTRISIDKKFLLKEIVYNADGRNPIYSHTQGVRLNNIPLNGYVEWEVLGGAFDSQENCAFSLLEEKDSNSGVKELLKREVEQEDGEIITVYPPQEVYILPDDEYDGGYCNNRVKAYIYKNDDTLFATVTVPIHMSLNTFGLASLNAWDGTSVTIDEDGGYIMAPQIGAGEKDSNNRFTGIVMGKTETYTGGSENEKEIGLLGYSHGLQSIFLDAKTGEATFGLPNGRILNNDGNTWVPDSGDVDDYGEGRIELRPGGVSKVGGWQFGKRALYYTAQGELNPDKKYSFSGQLQGRYDDDDARHHVKDIRHTDQGILLSADPAYISIKGRTLVDKDFDGVDLDNRQIQPGESLELQLDPGNVAMFAVYKHHKNSENEWTRTMLSGINTKGQLVANNLQQIPISEEDGNTSSSLGIDPITAFEGPNYIGLNLMAGGDSAKDTLNSFFRVFVNQDEIKDSSTRSSTPVYITGGQYGSSSNPNDYSRPINLYGKSISLYANPSASNNPVSDNFISIGDNSAFIGIENLEKIRYYGYLEAVDLTEYGAEVNPSEEGWYEYTNSSTAMTTSDTMIVSEKTYYKPNLFNKSGALDSYIYNVYNLYKYVSQYYDADGEQVYPKDFTDTDKWENHSLYIDLEAGSRGLTQDWYLDVSQLKPEGEDSRIFRCAGYPHSSVPYGSGGAAAFNGGDSSVGYDKITGEYIKLTDRGLPVIKQDSDGNNIVRWKYYASIYEDLDPAEGTSREKNFWYIKVTYTWESDNVVHDKPDDNGKYKEIITTYYNIAGDKEYPASTYTLKQKWIRNHNVREDITVLPEEPENNNPLKGWVAVESQRDTYDRASSSFLFLNRREGAENDYSDRINTSLLHTQNDLKIQSNLGTIDLISRGGSSSKRISLTTYNADNTTPLNQLSLINGTGVTIQSTGTTVVASTKNITLKETTSNSYLRLGYTGATDTATAGVALFASDTSHLLLPTNKQKASSLCANGNLNIISDYQQVKIQANNTAVNTEGIALISKAGSDNSYTTLKLKSSVSQETTNQYSVFTLDPTGFPDIQYAPGIKPNINYSESLNKAQYTSALTVGQLTNSGSNEVGGLAANWGYFPGTIYNNSNHTTNNSLVNKSIYAGHGILVKEEITAGGNISTSESISAIKSISAGTNISAGTDISANGKITAGGEVTATDNDQNQIKLTSHTHSFNKGITVKISQGASNGVSVTQGNAGSNATINVTVNPVLTGSSSVSGGEFQSASVTFSHEKYQEDTAQYFTLGEQSTKDPGYYKAYVVYKKLYVKDNDDGETTITINKQSCSHSGNLSLSVKSSSYDVSEVKLSDNHAATITSFSKDRSISGTSGTPN